MILTVTAPLAGTVTGLDAVPDTVFTAQMVGSGVAVEPPAGGPIQVISPVGGTLVKLHPHAFVVLAPPGTGILVHLGINTVRLTGEGFVLHVDEGAQLAAGDPVVTFNPTAIRARGLSAVCPIVVLDSPPDSIHTPEPGRTIAAGDPLFTWG